MLMMRAPASLQRSVVAFCPKLPFVAEDEATARDPTRKMHHRDFSRGDLARVAYAHVGG